MAVSSLKGTRDDSDPRITWALDLPGLYVIRLNGVHPSKGYHVIKLGRTDTTKSAKPKTRLRDYFSCAIFLASRGGVARGVENSASAASRIFDPRASPFSLPGGGPAHAQAAAAAAPTPA